MAKTALYNMVLILMLSACSIPNKTGTTPSQNQSLNSISPAVKEKSNDGFLQKSYDKWEKEDWEPNTAPEPSAPETPDQSPATQTVTAEPTEAPTPATVSNEEASVTATQTENNASKTFKMQDYVDKWGLYIERKEQKEGNTTTPSNVEKLDTMPAIGGAGSR